MNGIIEETLNLLQPKIEQKPEVDVIFLPEPYIRPFPCNPDRMKQLFINLVDNALKNTEKGQRHRDLPGAQRASYDLGEGRPASVCRK